MKVRWDSPQLLIACIVSGVALGYTSTYGPYWLLGFEAPVFLVLCCLRFTPQYREYAEKRKREAEWKKVRDNLLEVHAVLTLKDIHLSGPIERKVLDQMAASWEGLLMRLSVPVLESWRMYVSCHESDDGARKALTEICKIAANEGDLNPSVGAAAQRIVYEL